MQFLAGVLVAALTGLVFARRRRRRPGRTLIVTPAESTVVAEDGGVRSVQAALITLPTQDLQRLWNTENLENLGRTYWLFLTRCTLGLIRVVYTENERAVTLLNRHIVLLRFERPEYRFRDDSGTMRWKIKDGLLVARNGRRRGALSLNVQVVSPRILPGKPLDAHEMEELQAIDDRPNLPDPATDDDSPQDHPVDAMAEIRVEVEVSNFYPAISTWLGQLVYEGTQAVLHVLVTHSFLRSLSTLQLKESRVRRLSRDRDGNLRPEGEAPVPLPSPTATHDLSGPAG